MVLVENILVSTELFERCFLCNLDQCRGWCCVDGVAGAPLENEEEGILSDILPIIKPYLRTEGWQAIEKQGPVVQDSDGDRVTPLVNKEECAYVIFEQGIARCTIEKAFFDGQVSFRKPISCHLYPIRIRYLNQLEALNYHEWEICQKAEYNGRQMNVPVYYFVKEALIRRYGESWYQALENTAKAYLKNRNTG